MRTLVRHLWNQRATELAGKSRANCHAVNVHSIMLLDAPGNRIRLFYAQADHDLWRNTPETFSKCGLSVGFHPHHCDVTLVCCLGKIVNWEVKVGCGTPVSRYRFHSPLRGEAGRFEHEADAYVGTPDGGITVLEAGWSLRLPARALHTVSVEANKTAAWFVFEGVEDKGYEPICYSNDHLDKLEFAQLYQPISRERCEAILGEVGLL